MMRTRYLPILVLLAACTPTYATRPPVAPERVTHRTPDAPTAATTIVVSLRADEVTAILHGPFAVTAINPGYSLYLGLAASADCATVPRDGWFLYSGGGVVVGADQVLCARFQQNDDITMAFSGVVPH
jgi:hypothetical protein